MKKLSLLIGCWLCASGIAWAQSTTTVAYEPSDENFANPERGWHLTYEDYPEDFDNRLNKAELLTAKQQQGITLVKKRYLLAGVNQQDNVPAWVFQMLEEDFQTVREAGMKIMVQLNYNNEPNGQDAPKARILAHIPQFKQILADNSDVLALVIMGFVGQYGEWVNSSNDLLKMPDMQQIAYTMLDNLPEDRMISIRFPGYKRELVENKNPLSVEQAYNGSPRSRIGTHDDCFASNEVHYGTYYFGESATTAQDVEKVKNYLNQDNRFLPQGGETCGLCEGSADFYQSCEYALDLLKRLRYSTISHYEDIDQGAECSTIPTWMSGCEDEIRKKLGYRFQLNSAELPTQLASGETIDVSFNMSNVGWARPYNPRNVAIILRNQYTGQEYEVPINPSQDVRLWLPGPDQTTTLSALVTLPADLSPGQYDLLLNLPDPYPNLSGNPSYSIRLANQDTWEATTGYNQLNHTVTVGDAGAPQSLMDLLDATPRFSRLVAALEQTGLAADLAGSGPFTLFAPTNAAFEQLDAQLASANRTLSDEELVSLLGNHVVADEFLVSEVSTSQTITTLASSTLEITRQEGQVTAATLYNQTPIVNTDILVTNGVVQAVDEVLINLVGIIPLSYCPSQGLSTEDEWVAEVAIGSFSNVSGSQEGYGDFVSQVVELQAGERYPVTLTPGYTGTQYLEYWKIYADLNQNGDLEDDGELLFDAGSEQIGPISGEFALPEDALPGDTRLRVVMKYTDATDDDGAVPGACGTFGYGEVEDYTLRVTGGGGATTGNGLLGEYFLKDKNFAGSPSLTRIDSVVRFDWKLGSPDSQLLCDNFSVRWTGQVQPEHSEKYTFYTRSDDGVRLWVNGERIINNWTDHAVKEDRGKITLQAGQKYDIRLEYFENRGKAVCKLLWSSASQTKQVIPKASLYAPDAISARTADQSAKKSPKPLLVEEALDVSIYPNPSTQGVFTVRGVPSESEVLMYDLQGRSVPLTLQAVGEQQLQLRPRSALPPGLYVVQIRQPNAQLLQRKVVVEE